MTETAANESFKKETASLDEIIRLIDSHNFDNHIEMLENTFTSQQSEDTSLSDKTASSSTSSNVPIECNFVKHTWTSQNWHNSELVEPDKTAIFLPKNVHVNQESREISDERSMDQLQTEPGIQSESNICVTQQLNNISEERSVHSFETESIILPSESTVCAQQPRNFLEEISKVQIETESVIQQLKSNICDTKQPGNEIEIGQIENDSVIQQSSGNEIEIGQIENDFVIQQSELSCDNDSNSSDNRNTNSVVDIAIVNELSPPSTSGSKSVSKRACPITNLDQDEPVFKVPKIEIGDESEDGYQEDNTLNDCYYNFNLASSQRSFNNLDFDVLDEVDETTNGDLSTNEYSDSDISEDEIDALLDEGLTRPPKDKELAHEERKKVLLKIRGHNHFDVLPEGWIEVTHNSGMPVYLHKQSRVCTMSKPYFLGSGSARKHGVPISAIPCMHYRKEIDKEKIELEKAATEAEAKSEQSKNDKSSTSDTTVIAGPTLPPAKVESVQESHKAHSVDYMAVREYCKKLFDFQIITVRRFRTWAGRRKHQKILKEQQRPSLPEGTKLITCPLPPVPEKAKVGNGNVNVKREFIMNPCGKSFVCILHEYVQHAMRMQPKYIFKELENASTPYGAIVVINNMEYGSGYGSSKKQAKSEAARATLEILIPQLKEAGNDGKATAQDQQQDVVFFDEVRIEDSRVNELCAKAGQPSPYQILLECLKRNYGMGDTQIQFKMQNLKHQKNMFTMTVGKHEASVLCKNKRDGKQRASQAILQALHPHITSWGSLLRLYGKGSCKTLKEKKEEEQRITELQSKACANRPNLSILNKLKEEMLKLKVKQDAVRPIGKFNPEELELPSTSASNLKNVEL